MIKKIIVALITSLLFYVLVSFLILQVLHFTNNSSIENINDLKISFDWELISQNLQLVFIIRIGAVLFFCWMILKDLGIYRAKSKYEKTSFSKLLTRHQRKRGTVRVQYDNNGLIKRNTLECYYDSIMRPITRLQNDICKHFYLPEPKKWNTIYDYKTPEGKIVHHTSGIPVVAYRKYYFFGKFNRVNYLRNVIHALFVGMSGKGKSETFVCPMIQSNIDAEQSMFVHDPKGEILAKMRKPLENEGYKVIVINFVNPEESDGWNPLTYPYSRWKKEMAKVGTENYKNADLSEAIELVLDISKTISYQEDAQNPFWHEGAGDMIAAGAFLAMEEGIEENINFTTINYLYQLGEENDILNKYMEKFRTPDDQSVLKMDTYKSAEGITKSGLKATFKNKMSLLTATPAIQKLLGCNTWNFDEIFNDKTAIFLITHDEKSTYYPLVTIFIKQLYEATIKWTRDNRSKYNNKLKIFWNYYIDEMGLLPEIKDIEAMYGAARSRGIRIYSFFQSFAQLVQKYEIEGAKIIQDNSTHTIYLGSKLKEVADDFEKIAGSELYYDRKKGDWQTRPVITSEKLQKFEKGRSLITALEWNPFVAKLPPYNAYVFAKEEDWTKKVVVKPEIKWFDIRKAWAEKQKGTFKEKGAKVIKFNSLSPE